MSCVTQQGIKNHANIHGTVAAGRKTAERLERMTTMAHRAALVIGVSVLLGAGLGCAGIEDPREQDSEAQSAATEVAEQDLATTDAACDPNVGFTIKDGNLVKGSGSLPCAGSATVTLQRTWFGIWGTDLTSVPLNGAGDARSVIWNCKGTGRYTYRTYVTWRKLSGQPGFKESNHIEFDC